MKYVLSIFLMSLSLSVFATDIQTNTYYGISNFTVHSNSGAITPEWEGVTVVFTSENVTWNKPTSCVTNLVLVKKDDTQILSTIIAANMANKKVRYFVFDDVNIGGTYCFVRGVTISS